MDIDTLRTLLHYDPETGWFTWLVNRGGRTKAGDRAGYLRPDGYRRVRIDGRRPYEHRLVWMWHHGRWPTNHIDHINGIRDDNRIENLREATNAQNGANQGKPSTNTSGYKGVHWDKCNKKWVAQIRVNRKATHLGYFTNIEDAAATYQAAARQYFGEFAHL